MRPPALCVRVYCFCTRWLRCQLCLQPQPLRGSLRSAQQPHNPGIKQLVVNTAMSTSSTTPSPRIHSLAQITFWGGCCIGDARPGLNIHCTGCKNSILVLQQLQGPARNRCFRVPDTRTLACRCNLRPWRGVGGVCSAAQEVDGKPRGCYPVIAGPVTGSQCRHRPHHTPHRPVVRTYYYFQAPDIAGFWSRKLWVF